jgi:hypothetical protein
MTGRIYISGAVSDIDYCEAQARFNAAQAVLEARGGYEVVNPLNLQKWAVKSLEKGFLDEEVLHVEHKESGRQRAVSPDEFWRECMDVCLRELLRCDAIYMLNNWRTSRGARVELAVAIELGIEILIQGVITDG